MYTATERTMMKLSMGQLIVGALVASGAAIVISIFGITESLNSKISTIVDERRPRKEIIVNYATDLEFRIAPVDVGQPATKTLELTTSGAFGIGTPVNGGQPATETLGIGCKAFERNDGRPCDKTENEKLNEKLLVLLDHMNKEAKDAIKVAENQKLLDDEKTKKSKDVFTLSDFPNLVSIGKTVNTSPANNLSIGCGKELIKIYFADGRVEISEGVSLPEAAKMFWNAVSISYPEFRQTIISKYEKERKNE